MLRPALLLAAAISFATAQTRFPQPHPAWTIHTRAAAPNGRAAHIAAFEATPILAGNFLYVITPFDQVIALDPGTGAEKWRFDPRLPDRDYSEATARGVTVADKVVYFGTLDARLIALKAENGELLWDVAIAPGNQDGNYQITSPPVVCGNLVIVGSSIGDNSRAEMERGTIRAFDRQSGKLVWSWDPTPPGKTGAANAWTSMAALPGEDMVLLSTGSASPDFFGGLRAGDDRDANSVVALRASTGRKLWAFQAVHHDLWDYDVASAPIPVRWKGRAGVAVFTKVGHYFVLDRATGQPLLPVREVAVPKSDIPGEMASPTQPVPDSGVFTEQQFKARPGACEAVLRQLRYEGLFTPPSLQGSLEFPGNIGGANWGGGQYDPARGLVFLAENRLATIVRLIPRATYQKEGHGDSGERIGMEYAPQAGTPFGMVRNTFLGPDRLPCNQPPWGALVAIDVETGQIRWRTPGSVSLGGPALAGGLVLFSGNIFQHKLRAYSADDGHEVWSVDLPHAGNAVPATYTWNGKQYVVVPAGGHGKANDKDIGDEVVAFTLE